jgi:hypothetical protein
MPPLASLVRPAAIVGLLLAAVVGTTLVSTARQDKQDILATSERKPWHTEDPRPRFLTDREGWVRTPDEHVVEVAYDLKNGPNLAQVPLQMNGWVGRDAEVSNAESLPTLGADNFVFRQYWRPGDESSLLWLTTIGGTKGQSFHAPTVCYVAANWTVEDRPPQYIPVANGQVTARAIVARLDSGERFVDIHWYLWTDVRREWRLGATLMRVTVPVISTEEQALAVGTSFAQNFFTRVLG